MPWPRGLPWPVSVSFDVPANIETGVLSFGGHRVPLDLLGMVGSAPDYDHRPHYSLIVAGSLQYDFEAKRVTLADVEHDSETGSLVLKFSAVNDSEATDFTPLVRASVVRVSLDGTILDGLADPVVGWLPVLLSARGDTLAPGQRGEFHLSVPRVGGSGFRLLAVETEAPDVALLALTVTDEEATGREFAQTTSGLVPFRRTSTERLFWLPDLVVADIVWDPPVPSAGHDVTVAVTVANRDEVSGAGVSELVFLADGEEVARRNIEAIGGNESVIHSFTWTARIGPRTFVGVVDPESAVEESDETNNRLAVNFGGAFLPDLVVEGLEWSPAAPSVGDEVIFSLGLRNIGKGFVNDLEAHVFLDSEVEPSWVVKYGDVQGGQVATTTFVWSAKAGTHNFKAVADGPRKLGETNETNNEKAFSYDATILADLIIDTLLWAPGTPADGDNVDFIVAVRNLGIGNAGEFRVSVFLNQDSNVKWSLRFAEGIAAGGVATSGFEWTATPGSHTFRAVSDSDGDVPETNELNNESSGLMSCVAPC